MSSIKERPVLYRSDVVELYDRSILCLTDLMAIAMDKEFSISIDITPSGKISLKTYEHTKDMLYMKEQEKTATSTSYREVEYKN